MLSLPVRQTSIQVERLARTRGRSGWTFRAKLRFAVTSLLAHTNPVSWWLRGKDRLWRAGQRLAAPGATRFIRSLVADWLAQHPECLTHLDVGCGSRSRLDAHRIDFTGMDADAARVDLLRCRGADGAVASATELPFADRSFDVVWSFGLLHHLADDEMLEALAEMKRVTAPGGWVLVFDGVMPEPSTPRRLAALVRGLDRGSHLRSETQMRELLERYGPWECRRLTYTWNGLESLFCCHHKEGSANPGTSPCPSPPTSN